MPEQLFLNPACHTLFPNLIIRVGIAYPEIGSRKTRRKINVLISRSQNKQGGKPEAVLSLQIEQADKKAVSLFFWKDARGEEAIGAAKIDSRGDDKQSGTLGGVIMSGIFDRSTAGRSGCPITHLPFK